MDSLRGKLLLAGPVLKDPNFDRTVVLITEHTEEGAMGLVLNRPSEATVGDAVPGPHVGRGRRRHRVRRRPGRAERRDRAGRVGRPRRRPSCSSRTTSASCPATPRTPTRSPPRSAARASTPATPAGVPGQLEDELAEEAWIVEAPLREELFSDDAEGLWAAVLRRKGREFALLSTMPPDPSLN